MKTYVFQSCDSKECLKIEKEKIGAKNIDIISRLHYFDEEKNQNVCITCGKRTNIEVKK